MKSLFHQPGPRRRAAGVAAVEMGFLLIPLVLLTFGITEYGRAIYSYNALAKAARDGARFLTHEAPGDPASHAEAKCMVVYGTACGSSTLPLVPGLTVAMVHTCDAVTLCDDSPPTATTVSTGTGTINTVVVRIAGYPYQSLVPFVMPNIDFNDIRVIMRSQL
jgi:Flp pilus assembly protein TadG